MDLMLELCKCSLADYLDGRFEGLGSVRWYDKPSSYEISRTMIQLLAAVSFLHENQVAHADIKPDNRLKGSNSNWKLADFNLACELHACKAMSQYAGTPPYIAPEVVEHHYTEKCDLYSLGVLFIAMVFGREYARAEFWDSGVPRSFLAERTWLQHESLTALSFAKRLPAPEADRYDAEEALKSPFLGGSSCCTICWAVLRAPDLVMLGHQLSGESHELSQAGPDRGMTHCSYLCTHGGVCQRHTLGIRLFAERHTLGMDLWWLVNSL